MARNYATISTAIWRNDGFRALSRDGQHMYLLLTSQPDISAAGVLSLNAKRWSTRTAGATTEEVVAALGELQAHRFVVYDTDTEELLVRSFVRWDGGYGNPKRRPVIVRAAREVESEVLRQWLAAEFRRLDLPADGLVDIDADSLSPSDRSAADAGMDVELSSQANSLSDSHAPSEGVVVTKGPYVGSPTHNPHSPSQATTAAKPRSDAGTRLTEDWADSDEGKRGVAWAKEKYPSVDLDEEVLKFTNHWLSKTGKDATKRTWYRTFQNWIMEANRRLPTYARQGRMTGAMASESNAPKPIPADEKCPEHRGYRKSNCTPCRVDAQELAALAAEQ